MAQCPQCGKTTADTAQFCAACGLRLPHAASGAASPLVSAIAPPRWRGRRVVLWFLGIILVIATAFLVGTIYFIRHTTIVTATKNGGRVESPFGVVTTNNDPNQVAKALGLPVFPGAIGEKSAQADLAANTIAALLYHTAASPHTVINFYHVRFPDATVRATSSGPDASYTLVQINGLDTMTIKATRAGRGPSARTQIEINDIRH